MAVEHDMARSGVGLADQYFTECVCGWRSADLPTASDAGDALDEHLAAHGVAPRGI